MRPDPDEAPDLVDSGTASSMSRVALCVGLAGVAVSIAALVPIEWYFRIALLPSVFAGLVAGAHASDGKIGELNSRLTRSAGRNWLLAAALLWAVSVFGAHTALAQRDSRPQPALGLSMRVSELGSNVSALELEAAPGERIRWKMVVTNTGKQTLTDVVVRAVLPPHVSLDNGTVQYLDASGNEQLRPESLFASGYNSRRYDPTENAVFTFTTTLRDDFAGCRVVVRNLGYARSQQTGLGGRAYAEVLITKPDCP